MTRLVVGAMLAAVGCGGAGGGPATGPEAGGEKPPADAVAKPVAVPADAPATARYLAAARDIQAKLAAKHYPQIDTVGIPGEEVFAKWEAVLKLDRTGVDPQLLAFVSQGLREYERFAGRMKDLRDKTAKAMEEERKNGRLLPSEPLQFDYLSQELTIGLGADAALNELGKAWPRFARALAARLPDVRAALPDLAANPAAYDPVPRLTYPVLADDARAVGRSPFRPIELGPVRDPIKVRVEPAADTWRYYFRVQSSKPWVWYGLCNYQRETVTIPFVPTGGRLRRELGLVGSTDAGTISGDLGTRADVGYVFSVGSSRPVRKTTGPAPADTAGGADVVFWYSPPGERTRQKVPGYLADRPPDLVIRAGHPVPRLPFGGGSPAAEAKADADAAVAPGAVYEGAWKDTPLRLAFVTRPNGLKFRTELGDTLAVLSASDGKKKTAKHFTVAVTAEADGHLVTLTPLMSEGAFSGSPNPVAKVLDSSDARKYRLTVRGADLVGADSTKVPLTFTRADP